jgi:GT2 family glycosyltransferase
MIKNSTPLDRLVIVDNFSTDETRDFLSTLPLNRKIYNKQNLGCGVAWNQGILQLQTEWTIIMNNDVIVSPNWIENLITSAEESNILIVSPAMIEGPLDYNFDEFELNTRHKMSGFNRIGMAHAVCMAVHRTVWSKIGYFIPKPNLLGYEDTLFFHEARKQNIKIGITSAAWIHHYGSVTQNEMKLEKGLQLNDNLGARKNYRLLNQNWIERKISKIIRIKNQKKQREYELNRFGMTVHGIREDNKFTWL